MFWQLKLLTLLRFLFRSFFRSAATFVLLLFVVACAKKDLDLPEVSSSTISGKLSGFSSSSSLGLSDSANSSAQNSAQAAGINLSQSLVTAMSCSSATASLYRLDSSGTRVEPALATCALGSDGSFSFDSKTAGVSFSSSTPSETLIVSVSGCTSGVYSRPITGAKDQHVTMGSTVLSYMLNTSNKDKVYSALKNSPANFNSLIATLDSATTLADAYSLLSSNSAITSRFTNLFGVAPTTLDQASPEVVSNTLPSAASELVSAHLAVSVSHFSSSYNVVYAWKLDGTVIGTQADWNWTPTANMQGTHTLSLTIGESDGSGNVDTAKPVKTLSQALTITNNVLPTAPSFSITTPSVVGTTPINTRALTLTINTGGSKANCATFSSLALTENDSAAPAASAFTISCTQDGTQTLSYTLASSGDGLKTLRLWAIDASGTISSVASSTLAYLDTGSPTMTIATTPSALSNNASQTFSFAATDNGGVIDHYECKMDGGSYAACSTPKSYSGLSEADHTFYVKAFDTAGNASNVDSKTWHIDLTAPTLSVSGSPNAITNQLTATFSFSATDSGGGTVASLSCNLDSAGYASCASPYINVLSAGAHTLLIKATDTAGNVSAVQSFSWTIDTSLPTVTIASKPASLTNSTSASFTFSGTDTGGGSVASYECNLDSAGYSACTSVKTYTGLAASAHTISIRAIDTAGNIGSATSYNWTIDLTTPLASINSGPDSLTNSTSASFTFSANPPPSGSITGYECDIDSAGFASCSSPKSYSSLAQGSHTFQVRSIDNNGNRSTAVSQTWTVDTTAPTLTINSNPTSLNNSTSASFTFSATDSGGGTVASYACKLDSASYASCSSPISYSSLAQGSHTFYVTATDSAGNTSSATTNTWTTDLTAPAITISANPTAVTNSSSANFTFSATDSGGGAVSSYQCSIDGAAYATCTSIKSYTGLTAGSHQFALLAIDTAGNTSSASTYSWTIDTTAPTISITSTPSSPTNATTASFSFSATDSGGGAVASYACKIDAGSYASCTSPTSYSSLAAGAHTFYITSTDTAGNTSSASSVSWTIDLTAPTVAITTPAVSAVVLASNIASYAMSGTCSENGQNVTIAGSFSATATCASGAWSATVDLSAIADGTLSITAAQSDVAGNTTTTASRSFIKDTTVPTITVTTPSTMQGNVSTGSVTWTLTETNVAASTNFTVEIYNGTAWSSVGTKAATSGSNNNQSYSLTSFSVPNVDVTTARLRVTLVDAAGNSTTTQTGTFTIDSSAPSVGTFSINSGAATTAVGTVQIALAATDNLTTITDFCLKNTTGVSAPAAPTSADACWTALNSPSPGVTPATSISFSGFYYSLGLTSNTYKVFAWARNNLGIISALSNSGSGTSGADFASITFTAGVPPTVINVIAANTDSHQTPPVASELVVANAANVIVKWNASDDQALPATAVAISYTTDETNYTGLVSNLPNSQGSGCTVDGTTYTGCYVVAAPVGTYFKIRVSVTDSSSMTSFNSASPNNMGSFNLLAGNTEQGIGGYSGSAVFNVDSNNTTSSLPGSLVVSDSGIIYIRDTVAGILKIDPQNGILQKFIPYTGTMTNGAIGTATLRDKYALMTLDYSNNLIIYDYDRIRKVDLTNNTVTTLIGGGASRTSGTDATSFSCTTFSVTTRMPSVIPLPNGDIYFLDSQASSTTKPIFKYQASDQKVYIILPTGTGITNRPAGDDVSTTAYYYRGLSLAFNPTTSAVTKALLQLNPNPCTGCGAYGFPAYFDISTGSTITSPTPPIPIPSTGSTYAPTVTARNGNIYLVGEEGSSRMKVVGLNISTNTWSTVLGTGTSGYCADGTVATSCNVNVMDAFVTSDSRVFFLDNGLVRVIDSNNQVQTLYGQRRTYGDGGLALSARINRSHFFDINSTGSMVFADFIEGTIRKFTPGGNISLAGGDGSSSATGTNVAATSTGLGLRWWGGSTQMLVDQSTDDIYLISGFGLYKIQNSDQQIYRVVGAGSNWYHASGSDGLVGSSITIGSNEAPALVGAYNGKYLINATVRNASAVNYLCYLKLYDSADSYRQSHLAGNTNTCTSSGYDASGTATSGANVTYTTYNLPLIGQYLTDVGGWVMPRNGVATIKSYIPGGNITTFVTLPRTPTSVAIVKNASNQNVVYYCGSSAGKVYKYNVATSTETLLTWPGSSYTCTGYSIKYSSSRGSVIFPYQKNGLTGFAEILDTP